MNWIKVKQQPNSPQGNNDNLKLIIISIVNCTSEATRSPLTKREGMKYAMVYDDQIRLSEIRLEDDE